jgi:hypothetical protein
MKRFRKRKSIKLTLAMAVVAAVAVPVAQADPQPLQQLENATLSVAPLSENSPQFAARQAPSSAPIVDGHHGALYDRQQGGLTPGVNADGLRYQALAKHYQQQAATTAAAVDIKGDWAKSQTLTKQYEAAAAAKAAGLRYQAQAAYYGQSVGSTSSTPSPISDNSRVFGSGGPQVTPSATGGGSSFDWGDAAAGFGVAIGLMALMGIGIAMLGSRHRTAPA